MMAKPEGYSVLSVKESNLVQQAFDSLSELQALEQLRRPLFHTSNPLDSVTLEDTCSREVKEMLIKDPAKVFRLLIKDPQELHHTQLFK